MFNLTEATLFYKAQKVSPRNTVFKIGIVTVNEKMTQHTTTHRRCEGFFGFQLHLGGLGYAEWEVRCSYWPTVLYFLVTF